MAAAGCWQYAAGQAEQRQSWLPVCGGGGVGGGGGDAGVLERRLTAVAGLAHVGVCGTHAPACWAVVACGLAQLPPPTCTHTCTHMHSPPRASVYTRTLDTRMAHTLHRIHCPTPYVLLVLFNTLPFLVCTLALCAPSSLPPPPDDTPTPTPTGHTGCGCPWAASKRWGRTRSTCECVCVWRWGRTRSTCE